MREDVDRGGRVRGTTSQMAGEVDLSGEVSGVGIRRIVGRVDQALWDAPVMVFSLVVLAASAALMALPVAALALIASVLA